MERIVTTKEELEKAYNDKAEKIIVKGELAEKVYKCKVFEKAAPGAIVGLGAAIAAATAGLALTPVTGGLSAGASAVAMTTLVTATGADIAVIIIALSIGFAIVWGITHDYSMDMKFGDNELILTKKE